MKMLICLLAVWVGFLAACSRDNVANRVQGDPEISFDINGVHHSYTGYQSATSGGVGIHATRLIGTPGALNTFYSFAGYKNTGNIVQFLIYMTPPDTLRTKAYHCPLGSGSIIKADNNTYGFVNNDYLNFNISSYSNGTVNATFTGVITKIISVNPQVTEVATITNGAIKNVALKY